VTSENRRISSFDTASAVAGAALVVLACFRGHLSFGAAGGADLCGARIPCKAEACIAWYKRRRPHSSLTDWAPDKPFFEILPAIKPAA
jgi:hypothetical protein